MRRICRSNEIDDPERLISEHVAYVHEAGNPYYDYVFGGSLRARSALERWMHRSSSEVSLCRVAFVVQDDDTVGGFIAIGGKELESCRAADGIALAMTGGRQQREQLQSRLAQLHGLFSTVAPQAYYLSKLWVVEEHRGEGQAKELVSAYLREGREKGFTQFVLDVDSGNERAIKAYAQFGFSTIAQHECPAAGIRYLTMAAQTQRSLDSQ